MANELSSKESKIIEVFLLQFQKLIAEDYNIPFNPRSLTIVSQPDLKNNNRFDYISYNKWFDEMDIQTHVGTTSNFIQVFLEIPISILITAQDAGKFLLSKKDQNKLIKALKLLENIRLENQNEKD